MVLREQLLAAIQLPLSDFFMDKIRFRSLLQRLTSPPPDPFRDELRYWQERIIYSFLLIAMSFGALSFVHGVLLSFREEMFVLAITNIIFYLWIWILFFRRSLPYLVRAGSLIGYCYIIGLQFLVVTGPFGAGPTNLFVFPVAASLLLKPRYAFISLLINLVTLAGFGVLITNDVYDWPFVNVQPMETWIVTSLNFMLISSLATISVLLIVQGLQKSLQEKESTLKMLEIRNMELQAANRRLLDEMQAKEQAWAEREKVEMEKQVVEKSNRAIADWVNFIAHEIRSLVNGPLSYSQLGLRKLDAERLENTFTSVSKATAEESKNRGSTGFARLKKALYLDLQPLGNYFQRIFDASNRLLYLLNELLDLSKMESGNMPLKMDVVNMKYIIEGAVVEMEAALFDKQLQLIGNHSEIDMTLECDSFRIGQLMRNLLSNAIKFTPAGKTIRIDGKESVLERKDQPGVPAIRVTVADEGVGIPQDQISEVFEKFKQSRKTRKGEGTGLGLPICREIVHGHQGKIWVDSREQGGSRFHFSIPIEGRNSES